MELRTELDGLLGANVPLINLITYEEDRVIATIAGLRPGLGVYAWDLADGFQTVREAKKPLPKKEVTSDALLKFLADEAPEASVFVLKDFHHAWNQKKAYVTRKLRNMAPKLRAKNQFLAILTPAADLPMELKDDVVVLHVPLPDAGEIGKLFQEVTKDLERSRLPREAEQEKLITSALGLTTNQARLAFSRVWANYQRFDERGIEIIIRVKQEIIKESGALEFWPPGTAEKGVGGLDLLKPWLRSRAVGFTPQARARGVKCPRGVALIGVPGTGKSLTAKMLSDLWKWPLLRLDVGALFQSLLGESEQNMRRAIQLAEAVSPCILWIDELEKGFAGMDAGNINAGAPTRVFGTFITWMEEHQTPVYVVATANEIGGLRPELMGRFDRIFFLDLPNEKERREIFKIHLERAKVVFPERRFPMAEIVERSREYVGREIERVVREAALRAVADGDREMEVGDVWAAMKEIIPIARSHKEVIEELRRWKTEGRAYPASSEDAVEERRRGRVVEV